MIRRLIALLAAATALVALPGAPAGAQGCRRTVVFALPSVTWRDVASTRPPEILDAADGGGIGSLSVRTIRSRTSLAAGFATIGAGSRVEADDRAGTPHFRYDDDGLFASNFPVAGLGYVREVLEAAGYSTVEPGALASALGMPLVGVGNADLGRPPPVPLGYGRWTLPAVMDVTGIVGLAATGRELVQGQGYAARTDQQAIRAAVDRVLDLPCASLVVDHGDLSRVEVLEQILDTPLGSMREQALLAADELLGHIRQRLDRDDLLIVASPTSPASHEDVHFGVAIAVGPGFEPGTVLTSATTQRAGIVTLPDVAPTALRHAREPRPASMIGRPWTTAPASQDRIAEAIELDDESVFVDNARTPVATVFVIFQVVVFAVIAFLLWRRERTGEPFAGGRLGTALELAALAVVAFPVSTNLVGVLPQHELGPLAFAFVLVVVDAALVALAALLARKPLDRLLLLTAATVVILLVDTLLGARLQLNTVFSYSPIVAGRFAGVGNIVYSTLAATALITATLIVQRWPRSRSALAIAGGVLVATIVVDGAPMWGADVGGTISLVPGFILAWVLLSGRKVTLKAVALAALAAIVAFGAFLAIDLSRPAPDRTHLARLFEDVSGEGLEVFWNTVDRKLSANVRIFTSTIWTYLVPPAVALVAWLVVNPAGRWRRLSQRYPKVRAGLIAGAVLGVVGFLTNDSGIVIPALMLSFFVPLALLVHMSMERENVISASDALTPHLTGK